MSYPTQIYITHYVDQAQSSINDFLVEMVDHLEKHTPEPHRTNVVYWHPPGEVQLYSELKFRLPTTVRFIKCERQPRPDILPALRNVAVLDARAQGKDTVMVLLENDIRVSVGWLKILRQDLSRAENARGDAIVHPRYAPYVYFKSPLEAYPDFWKWLREKTTCITPEQLGAWSRQHGVHMVNNLVKSHDAEAPLEDNQALMMFITRARVFDRFGLCDETFVDWGYDDDDWAMRAILAGVANMQSQGAWISHLVGLTFCHPSRRKTRRLNLPRFIEKWYGNKDWKTNERPDKTWAQVRAGTIAAPDGSGPFYELHEVVAKADKAPPPPKEEKPSKAPKGEAPAPVPPGILNQIVQAAQQANQQPPEVVSQLIDHVSPIADMIDVGSGPNGPVGQVYWEKTKTALRVLDVYKVREMPERWKVYCPLNMCEMRERFGSGCLDWIQAFDVLEHVVKPAGLKWLREAKEMSRKAVLIFVPTSNANEEGFVDNSTKGQLVQPDNPFQQHWSGWKREDFEGLGFEVANWGPGYLFAWWER